MLTVLAFYFGNRFGQVFDFNTMEITDGALATVNSIVAAPAAISTASVPMLYAIGLAITVLIVWLYTFMYAGNYRYGEEAGSAKWGTLKEGVAFKDQSDPSNNLLFTKNYGLALKKPKFDLEHDRNLNVMVIGGSGSGKTRNYVKPNLMQLNASYFLTDPKGTSLPECGYLFRDNGYRIKVFNTIEFNKSMHYNPLKYVKTDADILSFVNCLISNTNGDKQSGGDPFWENSERLLYTALIALLRDWFPPEDYSLDGLLTLLSMAEAKENDENFKSPLDMIFDEIETGKVYERNPFYQGPSTSSSYADAESDRMAISENTTDEFTWQSSLMERNNDGLSPAREGGLTSDQDFALANYKMFKVAAGKTLKSIIISSSTQTLQLYGDDNTIAGRFWVTKSVDKNGRYNIISDASGFAFDQADGKTAEGTIVRLHSDGNNGSEWSNEAHKWRIEEVFFKGTISLDAERVEPGKTISVIDPSKTCTPYDQGGTGSVKYLYRWYWMKDERESPFAENKYPEAFTLSSWCHLANCGDQIWRDAYAGAGYPVRDTNFFVEAFKLRIKYGNGFIENNADFGAICYAGCMGIENSGDFSWSDVCRDGEELGKGGVSNRITGIKIWLEGDIAKEYDIAYRAFIYGQGWTERFHSNGGSQDDAELCGSDDASGSKGAIKCIQVFAIPKPRGAKLAREFAEDNSFIPENSHSGGYLTAQAMLALNLDDTSGFDGHKMIVDAYQGDSSKGLEALPVPPTPPVSVDIKVFYYVDGETDPCFEEEYKMGTTYQVNPDATAAGQKDNCLDLVCWYTDPEYTQPYEPQALDSSLKLYGYNPCSVKYDTTTRSSVLDTSYNWSTDADLGTALDLAALYPQDEIVKYGTKLTFAGPWSAWCEDAGKTRCVSSTPGVYATAGASGSPILSATIKGNTTVYVDWPWSGYDGVMSARS